MSDKSKFLGLAFALGSLARAIALLGPWVLGLAIWPGAAAQNPLGAETNLESRRIETLMLHYTPPGGTIDQPQATTYIHSAILTLSYSVSHGTGSGVASFTPSIDGATTLPGGVGLQSGQPIDLLTELAPGTHTFRVSETNNVGNTSQF